MPISIKIENLGKKYIICHEQQERYLALRDVLANKAKSIGRRIAMPFFHRSQPLAHNDSREDFWALKDISLEVKQGERIGVIGRNGAGKSTLLKIISRITEPTIGRISIKGRVASLLEVGTGFHPELTGGENIFLNGAILGMQKREIKSKFDKIVAFAGVEKFIDTPVKRYSNGMYVRLAFAVAAHLETEVLLVDEVLAVGDFAFQKQCIGKMKDAAEGGRTMLFVSHNTGAVRSLCKNTIWIDNGQIVKYGATDEVVKDYEENQLSCLNNSSYIIERNPEDVKNKSFYFSRIEMLNIKGENTTIFKYNDKLILNIDLAGESSGDNYYVMFRIYNELGQFVCSGVSAFHPKFFNKNVKKIRIEIGPLTLTSGKYRIALIARSGYDQADSWDANSFTIIECQPYKTNVEVEAFKDGVCVINHCFYEAE
jgi:lipopolysaccharide transport system ATP-binding protein